MLHGHPRPAPGLQRLLQGGQVRTYSLGTDVKGRPPALVPPQIRGPGPCPACCSANTTRRSTWQVDGARCPRTLHLEGNTCICSTLLVTSAHVALLKRLQSDRRLRGTDRARMCDSASMRSVNGSIAPAISRAIVVGAKKLAALPPLRHRELAKEVFIHPSILPKVSP